MLLPPTMVEEGKSNETALHQPYGDDPIEVMEFISRELEQRIKTMLEEERQTVG